ncbi:hypothetical protein [Streptomyces sp. NPDC047976]|uniref:hypothetical protein n=1 Tax=Streptomyces sp. NPDC047976 TaxID=3155746 RepID=UPI0034456ADD
MPTGSRTRSRAEIRAEMSEAARDGRPLLLRIAFLPNGDPRWGLGVCGGGGARPDAVEEHQGVVAIRSTRFNTR